MLADDVEYGYSWFDDSLIRIQTDPSWMSDEISHTAVGIPIGTGAT